MKLVRALFAIITVLALGLGQFIMPAHVGATPLDPFAIPDLPLAELLPQGMEFVPNGPGCGCGGMAELRMPEGIIAPSPQGKSVMSQKGGFGRFIFGGITEFRVASPDSALRIMVDGRPYAATNFLTKVGKELFIVIDPGQNVSRLEIQIQSSFGTINPGDRAKPISGQRYFAETGHNVDPAFNDFWETNGGLAQFGYPLSERGYQQLEDKNSYIVQYFERGRFEYHPENPTQSRIILGQFGRLVNGGVDPAVPAAKDDTSRYFPQTGHNVSERNLRYWQSHGGLAQFGYPISEEKKELLDDGKTYMVQYFERARFEYHPENAEPYKVLLGQFGRGVLGLLADRRELESR